MKKKTYNHFIPLLILAAMTAVFVLCARIESEYVKNPNWQLEPEARPEDYPSGFDGLSFCGKAETRILDNPVPDPGHEAEEVSFRLTRDEDTDICYAYVPAEMNKALHLKMNSRETLVIRETGEDSEDSGKKKISGSFHCGEKLPVFPENVHYSFSILDSDENSLGSEEVVFIYTKGVPSMYIDTESGSMEAIDGDKHHETEESAVYRIFKTDGSPESSGTCAIKGRGNSTWSLDKRPYNINMDEENILLGMNSCRKYALIANFWDSTQTRQYYAFLAAEKFGLEFTPQTRFVNLYLNGRYQSLYLLTQRLNVNGGSVKITNLDKENEKVNSEQADQGNVETIVQETDKKGHESVAYAWENDPADITGGYLLELDERYSKEDVWFSTETHHVDIASPQQPSVGEYEYIADYVRAAEKALFSKDWTNEDTGLSCFEYFDMESWARMYLIQEFFVQSDDEFYSFYFYKKPGDPLLYCGPVWDFDLCLGNMNSGEYYRTSAQTLWLKDSRKRWLHRMGKDPDFAAMVSRLYLEEFEPVIRDLLDNKYDKTVDRLEKITKINYFRWHKDLNYEERTDMVRTLMETRVQFLHDYYTDPDSFHRLVFHFAWDDFSYYVRDGESMGFLPTYDYGEKQSTPQREANGFITGWSDSNGNLLSPDTPIYQDMEFDPVYIP